MATPQRQPKSPPHRGPGRPSQGIRSGYVRLDVYVPLDLRTALDRIADNEQQYSGETVTRSDVVREALEAFVRQHARP